MVNPRMNRVFVKKEDLYTYYIHTDPFRLTRLNEKEIVQRKFKKARRNPN